METTVLEQLTLPLLAFAVLVTSVMKLQLFLPNMWPSKVTMQQKDLEMNLHVVLELTTHSTPNLHV
jgi:hypothetical protein